MATLRPSTALFLTMILSLTAGCSDQEPQHTQHQFGHVHGLGVNPADQTLYAATHTGVFAIENGSAHLIANRRQDTMGFTVVGPDQFLGSGHPASLNEPNPLGLIRSDDAAKTWSAPPCRLYQVSPLTVFQQGLECACRPRRADCLQAWVRGSSPLRSTT